jgi:ABC-2 type transport system ATP-binding protein
MGMKQRLGIAAALLGDPALLILDEPTNGLDPAGIHEMRQLIRGLADEGRTIFVSSHILVELEQVCDWFVIIDRGSLVFQGSKSQLLDGAEASLVVAPEHAEDLSRLEQLIARKGHAVRSEPGAVVVDVGGAEPRLLAADLNRSAAEAGLVLVELRLERMNLEERYLTMANGGKP